jgi:hypothetical protein
MCTLLDSERLLQEGPEMARRIADGLSDNWSQVRDGRLPTGALGGPHNRHPSTPARPALRALSHAALRRSV